MKKKIIIFLITLILLVGCMGAFSACESEEYEEFLPPNSMWIEEGILHWNKVPGVDQYILNLNGVDITVKNNYYENIKSDVQYTATVKASRIWDISDKSEPYSFKVLKAPEKIQYIGEVLFWSEVENATSYVIEINGREYSETNNFIEGFVFAFPEEQAIRIKAVGDGISYSESIYSEELNVYILARHMNGIESVLPNGSGTSNDPYLISNIENYKWMWEENKNGNSFKGVNFSQTSNIDFRYVSDYEPLGLIYSFQGTYNGNNYGIDNLSYVGQLAGVFGVVGSSGAVMNVIKYSGELEGRISAGAIVAINNGQVSGCKNYSYIYGNTCGGIVGQNNNTGTVLSCENHSKILGDTSGGIVGWNMDGMIISCSNNNMIESTSIAGGICGNNAGFISLCENNGTVDSKISGGVTGENRGEIEYSRSNAYIKGSMYAGGICGENEDDIEYSYAYGDVVIDSATQNSYVGGLVGKNTEGKIKFSFALNDVTNINGGAGSIIGYYRIGLVENIYTSNTSLPYTGNDEISYVGEMIDFTEEMQNSEYISTINSLIKERYEEILTSIFKYEDRLMLYFE